MRKREKNDTQRQKSKTPVSRDALSGVSTRRYDCRHEKVVRFRDGTHRYDWLRQALGYKDVPIITLALQAHNGERSKPHNSKLKSDEKREDISALKLWF